MDLRPCGGCARPYLLCRYVHERTFLGPLGRASVKVGVCGWRAAGKHWASSRQRRADVSLFWTQTAPLEGLVSAQSVPLHPAEGQVSTGSHLGPDEASC